MYKNANMRYNHAMNIELSKEQFRELLLVASVGNHVRRGALMAEGNYEPERDEELMGFLYETTYEAGIGLVEAEGNDRAEENAGAIMPTQEFEDAVHSLLESFSDEQFWHELSLLLAQRDLERTMTNTERVDMAMNGGEMPERLFDLCERYEGEFETFGIDRLEINEGAPVSDLRDVL